MHLIPFPISIDSGNIIVSDSFFLNTDVLYILNVIAPLTRLALLIFNLYPFLVEGLMKKSEEESIKKGEE
jgi:hypothetical protein